MQTGGQNSTRTNTYELKDREAGSVDYDVRLDLSKREEMVLYE